VKWGIRQLPGGKAIFAPMSVRENLEMAGFMYRADKAERRDRYERALDVFPELRTRLDDQAGSLSGGQQQMLGLGIALLRRPKLIMLDEPSTGLAPVLVEEVFRAVATLQRDYGTGFLIVDQNVRALLSLSRRAYVLKSGRVVYAGPSSGLGESETLWGLF